MTQPLVVNSGEYCPHCSTDKRRKVVDTRLSLTDAGPIRWRRCVCPGCGGSWRTVELMLPEHRYRELSKGD